MNSKRRGKISTDDYKITLWTTSKYGWSIDSRRVPSSMSHKIKSLLEILQKWNLKKKRSKDKFNYFIAKMLCRLY